MIVHVVTSGETLYSIASSYGADPARLAADNTVPASGALAVGQTLVIRFPRQVHAVQPGETLYSIAAAYGHLPAAAVAAQLAPWRAGTPDARSNPGDFLF